MEPATLVNVMRWSSGSSTRMLLASSKNAPCLQYFFHLPGRPSFPASHRLPTGFPPASPGSFYGVYQPRVYEVPFLAFVPGAI